MSLERRVIGGSEVVGCFSVDFRVGACDNSFWL